MKDRTRASSAGHEAVSRGELDSLRDMRRRPALILEHTPSGPVTQIVRQQEESRLASRTSHIKSRLDGQEGRAATDFSLAKMKGHVGGDFERAR